MTTDFLNDSVGEVMIESNELAQDDALIESFRPYRQHILNGSVRADVRISYGLIPCCYRGNQVLVQLCKERFSDEYSDFICMRMPLWELERFMSLFYEDELRRVMKFSPSRFTLSSLKSRKDCLKPGNIGERSDGAFLKDAGTMAKSQSLAPSVNSGKKRL
jgi:hypothetical protein